MDGYEEVIILNINELYYLSHPYSTFGDPEDNKKNATAIQFKLYSQYRISVINPIVMPLGSDYDKAMEKCRSLYDACDAIILCPGWENSTGCSIEYQWALQDGKPIYYFINGTLYRDAQKL